MAELGVELPDWTPPPWPGPMRLDGRYARLEPLAPGHATALFAANRADDAIWDYLPYGPFAERGGLCRLGGADGGQGRSAVLRA